MVFDEKMEEGQVFVPFTKLKESAANFLTNSASGPGFQDTGVQGLRRQGGDCGRLTGYDPANHGNSEAESREL